MEHPNWYQSRHVTQKGQTSKALRIWLTPEEWAAFDNVCRESEWSRSNAASVMLSDWLRIDAEEKREAPHTTAFRLMLRKSLDEVSK